MYHMNIPTPKKSLRFCNEPVRLVLSFTVLVLLLKVELLLSSTKECRGVSKNCLRSPCTLILASFDTEEWIEILLVSILNSRW